MRFTGLIARNPAPRQGVQYEVSNLAHAGRRTGEDLTPQNREAFARLGIDVTLILSGTVDEMTSDYCGGERWLTEFQAGLRTRAADARRTGRCVIVPPAPLPVGRAIARAYLRVEQRVARQVGCTFVPVLARVWRSPGASVAGRPTHEGIHPTRAGYARMAQRPTPNAQRPTPNAQRPTPNAQRPTPNARALVLVVEHIDRP